MRPHEETWTAVGQTLEGALVAPHPGGFSTFAEIDGVARAQLAAQAPAMARLLLEMWEESQERNGPQYPLAIGDVLRAAGVIE